MAVAPKPGDADFPKPSPSRRHDEKVAAVKAGNFDLAMVGDSITETVGDGGDGEWKPLKAVWDRRYAPRHAINLGYSGYRTENIFWNLLNGELDFTHSPKVITLLIGTNNTDDQHYPSVHTAEQVFAGIKAIVDLIRQRHPTTKILILGILPSGGPNDRTSYHRKYNRSAAGIAANRRANELTAQLADGKGVFWLDVGHVFLRPDGSINTDLMPDMIHPNAAGAEARAQAMEPLLATLLGDKPLIDPPPSPATVRETREIAGWKVHVSEALLAREPTETAWALELLQKQLEEIVRVAPPPAVAELQKVPLYFSPEYPGLKPRAEFHPSAVWLRDNGRDPVMAKAVEFTNIRIFEREMNRMPNFALHELAHAYHDRVLPQGFDNPEIKAAYEKARAGDKYARVERWHGNGEPNTFERAYAMTNPQEFFAENTEAFFSRNDYFPFTRDELKQHDPETFALLEKLWTGRLEKDKLPK
jgi:lysophospholipase L1-like esterase